MDNLAFTRVPRRLGAVLGVLGVLFALSTVATAQDSDGVSSCNLTLPADAIESTAFAFRVDVTTTTDAGQFATIALCAQTAEGWTRLTPCDDMAVMCAPVTLRMEDAVQGETLVTSIEAP